MSVAFYIVLDEKKPGFGAFVNGKALAKRRDLDEVARMLGVRPLSEFIWVSPKAIAPADEASRMEVVAKLGLRQEPGYIYYLKGSEVWRKKRLSADAEKVADGNFVREDEWFYTIRNGDIVRTPKHQSAKPGARLFAAEEGLTTVRALRAHYAELADAKPVVADLDEYERVLAQAASKGFRFHLGVDF